MFHKFLISIIFLSGSFTQAQVKNLKSFQKQFSFTCDNDFFLLSGSDRYYTNGLCFDYYYISKKNKTGLIKQVNKIQLSQKIYTPYKRKIIPGNLFEIDRPITGYLFINYSQVKFLRKNQMWFWGINPGVIGSAAFGKEIQTLWHRIIGIRSKWDWIWEYQLKNEAGLNGELAYAFNILNNPGTLIQISPKTHLTAGTILANITQSVVLQFGKFNLMSESDMWDSNIRQIKKKTNLSNELFIFYEPSILYQAYNSTIQGGLFRNNKGPITAGIHNWVLSNDIGFTATNNKYAATFKIVYQGREAQSQFDSHIYGSIKFSARF